MFIRSMPLRCTYNPHLRSGTKDTCVADPRSNLLAVFDDFADPAVCVVILDPAQGYFELVLLPLTARRGLRV